MFKSQRIQILKANIKLIDDKNDNEHLRQAMTQEQLKRVQTENQKKKGNKLATAYKIASRMGSAIQKL